MHNLCLHSTVVMIATILILYFSTLQCVDSASYPDHASCNITWNIPMPCKNFQDKLIKQMEEWRGDENCGQLSDKCTKLPCGQNCLYYSLGLDEEGILRAMHQTPVHRYNDSLSFEFLEPQVGSDDCVVQAFSSSDLWYAYLDFGTNYCNLNNLINAEGLGITSLNGFEEDTALEICTQYDQINCDKY